MADAESGVVLVLPLVTGIGSFRGVPVAPGPGQQSMFVLAAAWDSDGPSPHGLNLSVELLPSESEDDEVEEGWRQLQVRICHRDDPAKGKIVLENDLNFLDYDKPDLVTYSIPGHLLHRVRQQLGLRVLDCLVVEVEILPASMADVESFADEPSSIYDGETFDSRGLEQFFLSGASLALVSSLTLPLQQIALNMQVQQALTATSSQLVSGTYSGQQLPGAVGLDVYIGATAVARRLVAAQGETALYIGLGSVLLGCLSRQGVDWAVPALTAKAKLSYRRIRPRWRRLPHKLRFLLDLSLNSLTGAAGACLAYRFDYKWITQSLSHLFEIQSGLSRPGLGLSALGGALGRGYVFQAPLAILADGGVKERNIGVGLTVAIVCASLCYPLDTVRNCQMVTAKPALQVAKGILERGGLAAFFGGFEVALLQGVLTTLCLQGCASLIKRFVSSKRRRTPATAECLSKI
eukprot:g28200.t1